MCGIFVAARRIFSVAVRRIFSWGMQTLSCGMWDLVPWPGIEPGPPALGAQSLSHWTTREVPLTLLIEAQLTFNISFRCTTQWFNTFTDYTPYKVIIKSGLYSVLYITSLDLIYFTTGSLYLLIPFTYFTASPALLPSGNHWFVLCICKSVSEGNFPPPNGYMIWVSG